MLLTWAQKGVKEVENETPGRLTCFSTGSSSVDVNDGNCVLFAFVCVLDLSTITHSTRWLLHTLLPFQRGWGHSPTHDDSLFLSVISAASCYHYPEAESEVLKHPLDFISKYVSEWLTGLFIDGKLLFLFSFSSSHRDSIIPLGSLSVCYLHVPLFILISAPLPPHPSLLIWAASFLNCVTVFPLLGSQTHREHPATISGVWSGPLDICVSTDSMKKMHLTRINCITSWKAIIIVTMKHLGKQLWTQA